tara:strand:+ start:183 stop:404 length:222 start_codon:yes stop_codon:yes gene_type:complete
VEKKRAADQRKQDALRQRTEFEEAAARASADILMRFIENTIGEIYQEEKQETADPVTRKTPKSEARTGLFNSD